MAKLEEQVTPTELVEIILDGISKQEVAKRFRTSDEELALMLSQQYREGRITKEEFNAFFKGQPVPSRRKEVAPEPKEPTAEQPAADLGKPVGGPEHRELPAPEVPEPAPSRPAVPEPAPPSPYGNLAEAEPQIAREPQEFLSDEIIDEEMAPESMDVELESVEVESIEVESVEVESVEVESVEVESIEPGTVEREVFPEAPKEKATPEILPSAKAADPENVAKMVPLARERDAQAAGAPQPQEEFGEPAAAAPTERAQIENALHAIIAKLSSIDNRLAQIENKLGKQ